MTGVLIKRMNLDTVTDTVKEENAKLKGKRKPCEGLPGGPVVKIALPVLPLQGVQVRSLVWELRFCMPWCGQKIKESHVTGVMSPTSQGTPRITGKHQMLEEARKDSPLELSETT